ncbi:uncharacterized protein BXZ73DRAFT_77645 [Epithele typhae]|uniref:uncharacterized protein n=1 Tax=Epithele typhae TaxID=378194 RepID=UPI002007E86D|nr:uncharacterized protein BXZ73DRAFT_77645 [Epithele typhae]KAH9931622.1 hypothetical protein BXZ73DRAFT_77645 [Epithele typhae]
MQYAKIRGPWSAAAVLCCGRRVTQCWAYRTSTSTLTTLTSFFVEHLIADIFIPATMPSHNQSLCPRHDRYVRRSSPRVANASSIPSAEIRLFRDWLKTLVTVKQTVLGGQFSVEPSSLLVILARVSDWNPSSDGLNSLSPQHNMPSKVRSVSAPTSPHNQGAKQIEQSLEAIGTSSDLVPADVATPQMSREHGLEEDPCLRFHPPTMLFISTYEHVALASRRGPPITRRSQRFLRNAQVAQGRFTKAVRDCFRVNVSQQAGICQEHAAIMKRTV